MYYGIVSVNFFLFQGRRCDILFASYKRLQDGARPLSFLYEAADDLTVFSRYYQA
jgi:hypothetical protein